MVTSTEQGSSFAPSSQAIPSEAPSLANLSRNALLYGLALGYQISLPGSTYLDDDFWLELLQEASSRNLLCDAFLNGLVTSGVCISKLVISAQKDIGITPEWYTKSDRVQLLDLTSFTFLSASFEHPQQQQNYYRNYCEELSSLLYTLARRNKNAQKSHTLSHLHLELHCISSTLPSMLSKLAGSIKEVFFSNYSSLQVLKLEGIKHMEIFEHYDENFSFVEALAEACVSVTTLSFSKSTGFRDRHGQALLASSLTQEVRLQRLQDLDLSYTAVGNLTFIALHNRAGLIAASSENSDNRAIAPIQSQNLSTIRNGERQFDSQKRPTAATEKTSV